MVAALALVAPIALAASACDLDPTANDVKACTAIGCGLGASFELPLTGTWDEIRALKAQACAKSHCCAGSLDVGATPPAPYTGLGGALKPESFTEDSGGSTCPSVVVRNDGGSFLLEVEWPMLGPGDVYGTPATAGDVWSVDLFRADGTRVGGLRQAATGYDSYRPNGPSCEPTCFVPAFPIHDAGTDAASGG